MRIVDKKNFSFLILFFVLSSFGFSQTSTQTSKPKRLSPAQELEQLKKEREDLLKKLEESKKALEEQEKEKEEQKNY